MTDQQINQAIAKACGWRKEDGVYMWTVNRIDCTCPELWDWCNDLNAMHDAESLLYHMGPEFARQLLEIVSRDAGPGVWYAHGSFAHVHATARQRAEAFLLTSGKWSATDKESLTVAATTEQSSAVQSASSGGSGGASTYGGKGLGIAGGDLPPETQITVNGKTFCLADIDKEMTE